MEEGEPVKVLAHPHALSHEPESAKVAPFSDTEVVSFEAEVGVPEVSAEVAPVEVGEPVDDSLSAAPVESRSAEVAAVEVAEPIDGSLSAVSPEPPAEIPAVQVCVRLRPLLDWERTEGHESSSLDTQTGTSGSVTLRPKDGGDEPARSRVFRFDAVIGSQSSQEQVWRLNRVEELLDKVVEGFHVTVFAYGQTGSGKTHTMEGFAYEHHNGSSAPSAIAARPRAKIQDTPPEQLGVVPRAVVGLFARTDALQGDGGNECVVRVSFLQIYKERIFDLLNPGHSHSHGSRGEDSPGLRMRWDAGKRQFFVENLFQYECSSADDVLHHYGTGVKNKQVASTAMNVASSRSHTILVLTVVRRSVAGSSSALSTREVVSKLALVDLAGSERAAASNCGETSRSAARFKEAVTINQSLFVLRRVITALSQRQEGGEGSKRLSSPGPGQHSAHVPYRESKLTSMLQHSIGGNSFLLMLACLSPSDRHFEENLSTLQYASQAASIKNAPTVNLDPKDKLIQQLQQQLLAAHAYILRLTGLSELPAELLAVGVPPPKQGSSRTSSSWCAGRQSPRTTPRTCSLEREKTPRVPRSKSRGRSQSEDAPRHQAKSSTPRTTRATERPPSGPGHHAPVPDGPRDFPNAIRGSTPRLPRVEEALEVEVVTEAPVETLQVATAQPVGRVNADLLLAAAAHRCRPGSEQERRPSPKRPRAPPRADPLVDPADPSTWPARAAPRKRPPSLPPSWDNGAAPPRESKSGLPPIASVPRVSSIAESLAMYRLDVTQPTASRDNSGFCRSGRRGQRGKSQPSPRVQARDAAQDNFEVSRATIGGDASNDSVSTPVSTSGMNTMAATENDAMPPYKSPSSTPQADDARKTFENDDHADAMNCGLWEAIEELKSAKFGLEAKLRMAENRAKELEGKLEKTVAEAQTTGDATLLTAVDTQCPDAPAVAADVQAAAQSAQAPARAWSTPPPREEASTATAPTIADVQEREAFQAERQALLNKMEELEVQARAALESAEAATAAQQRAESAAADAAAAAVAAAEAEEGKKRVAAENDTLKRERASLKDQLEVFERLMDAEANEAAGAEDGDAGKTSLGDKVQRFHSQLALEAVGLRKEIAGLKKKKWVLRSVLATGGESERRAIEAEVAELRRNNTSRVEQDAGSAAEAVKPS